ncbi:MAG: DPP IV N-terminal domain-containing protein, partial [Bacteroidaceae bacterium]|nr:DPP IV N-terminal domain-containing protein [Bacteroidaceae bacterium]
MKRLFITALVMSGLLGFTTTLKAQERLPEYLQAEKFTQDKLKTMLFSTTVDPHWFQQGNNFWFEYKTSEGTFWYVVNPTARTKNLLFNREEIAAQLTEIVQDPFEARQLPIKNLKAKEDGRTFTFEVTSSRDAKPKKGEKKGKAKKEVFYFSYDYPSRKLTHLKDQEEEPKRLMWGTVSPDKKTVVYAKDLNLYKMSYEDYLKAKKNEKDSTIVEIQLTTDGMEDFGYGIPRNMLNTDTLCNGKRRSVYGAWSPDSRHFVTSLSDNRAVKDLWVINVMAQPRPTLETYKYQMPGEKEAPVVHLYLFDMQNNTRKEIQTAAYKDQTVSVQYKPMEQKQRDMEVVSRVWQGDNNRFFLTRSSRDLYRIDICSYTIGQDSIVPIIKERMNTYQETRPLKTLSGGKELIQWSERDGWAHLYLYDDKGNLKNRITKGPWHVEEILKVDEKARVIYFTANGRNKGENPYYEHLYRVNADGSGLQQITKGDYFHQTEVDDDARFVVDNYSRVNTIPTAVLLDNQGNKVMDL